jgi:hypothetical protein
LEEGIRNLLSVSGLAGEEVLADGYWPPSLNVNQDCERRAVLRAAQVLR